MARDILAGLTAVTEFPGDARYAAYAFKVNGRIYAGGGISQAGTVIADFYEYDPDSDNYIERNSYAAAVQRRSCAAFSIGNYGFLVGGVVSGETADVWAYDSASGSWYPRTAFAGGVRQNLVGVAYGGKGYCGLGYTGGGYAADWYEFDPTTNAWTAKTAFPGSAREGAFAFELGGLIYVGGGYAGTTAYTDVYAYNPSANTWSGAGAKTAYPVNVRIPFAFTFDGKAYVGGGEYYYTTGFGASGWGARTEAYEFDPAGSGGAGSWTAISAATNGAGSIACHAKGKVFIAGGYSNYFYGGGGAPPLYPYSTLYSTAYLYRFDNGIRVANNSEIIKVCCEAEEDLLSPVRFGKNSRVYGISLVDPTSEGAIPVYVETASGIKAFEKIPA